MINDIQIIDCHAHVFPDNIAPKVIKNLEEYYKMSWQCSGTIDNLRESLTKAGIYKAVVFSTCTKPSQVQTINNFMHSLNDERFICFGSVHPDYTDYKDEIKRIKNLNLKGMKFHPDFQNFKIDDDKMLRIYEQIGSDVPIIIHTGDENSDNSSPRRLAKVVKMFPNITFIAAHLGGYMNWEYSKEYLIGLDVYIDTSSTLCKMSFEKAAEIINLHGADKVLFGTDYPAVTHKYEINQFMQIPISYDDKVKILSTNAKKLFM